MFKVAPGYIVEQIESDKSQSDSVLVANLESVKPIARLSLSI